MTEAKEKAREAAWQSLGNERDSDELYAPYERWHFEKGFDAGYSAAAGQWVKIEGPESLPKETNDYLWLGKPYEPNDTPTTEFFDTEEANREWWIENYVAYMPIPPFTE